jgi:hypothetical protein
MKKLWKAILAALSTQPVAEPCIAPLPAISEKKWNFLNDVMHEVEMLRQHATPDEVANLNLATFDPKTIYNCIYGQMTGRCTSNRAKELMDVACIRMVHNPSNYCDGMEYYKPLDVDDARFNVNGEYNPAEMFNSHFGGRTFSYMSAIEGYILTENANIEGIMAYLKGETDTLEL